jgi:hypothetical protein
MVLALVVRYVGEGRERERVVAAGGIVVRVHELRVAPIVVVLRVGVVVGLADVGGSRGGGRKGRERIVVAGCARVETAMRE